MDKTLDGLFGWTDEDRAQYRRYSRRLDRIQGLTDWMRRIPIVGGVVGCFWYTLLAEGPMGLKPRWGALTFSYLNDGDGPTPWHIWRQMTRDHMTDPYTGLWPGGAPTSKADADRKLAEYAAQQD